MGQRVDARSGELPRLGRPPRISQASIVEAAHEIGLEGLTLKAVADRLGVSIGALYHHVSSKDDLMRLTAELSARRVPLPEDHGQHWALWLSEWATYNRDAFLEVPQLLTQYLEGAISAASIARNVDTILGLLVRQGFTILEANAAYDLVTSCAIGAAIGTIREREANRDGRALTDAHLEVLAHHGPDELPYYRDLVEQITTSGREPFVVQIATVLTGIAVRQGLDWEPISRLLEEADATAARPSARRRKRTATR